ncbi:transglutaminase domain-containing protein [Calidifontibacillus oryziterrae]|uniref:transglutaminase domain-containing protein n=1 Tax=Calidifontibacillus oryziterrae TaxID=1191699 RepID=UPI0002F10E43|nr:transglutaminase domain-containing protein [Calidifontibacillus oryziterrae]
MKFFKRMVFIPLLILSLVVSPLPALNGNAANLPVYSANIYDAAKLKDIESIIKRSMGNREPSVVIKYKGSTNRLLDIISGYISNIIQEDEYLNYSYRSANMSYKAYGLNVTITLQFKYYETAEQVKYVDKTVKTIVNEIIKPEMNEHEKVKAIHDYVVLNLAYDTQLVNNSPYPALTTGKTACNGYAMLVYKMLKQLGIEVRLISGVASSSSFATQNHAWNMVKLDGNWYHLDATWDDPIPDEQGRVLYNYYLLTDKEISKDHQWGNGGINGEEKPYPLATKSYFNELQVKINSNTERDRFQQLLHAVDLHYLLPDYTAKSLRELNELLGKEFNNYKKEFTVRYVDKNVELKSSLRKIIYDSAVNKGIKSWSYSYIDYNRGTSQYDRLITISDVVYHNAPIQPISQQTIKYPALGFNSIGTFQNVDHYKIWIIEFSDEIDTASANSNNIYMLDSRGAAISALQYNVRHGNELLIENNNGYLAGETYYLFVNDTIKSKTGKRLTDAVSIKFSTKN